MKFRYWIVLFAVLTPAYLFLFHPNRPSYAQKTDLISLIRPLEIKPQQTGIAGIDCIYCINLDVRKDKWKAMHQKLSDQGLKANRVPAINGWKELAREQIKAIQKPYKSRLNKGQVGCLLSHLSILKDAENRNFDRVLILEDDVNFVSEMKDLSKYLDKISALDPEWDILFLDDWTLEKNSGIRSPKDRADSKMSEVIKKPKEVLTGTNFVRTYYRHGAYAMVVSKNGARKISEYFIRTPLFFAYDLEFNHIHNIKMYETDKDFVTVDLKISDTSKRPKKTNA
jgi:GR25 family glycosyltransferase involved in LPS biosynthesis